MPHSCHDTGRDAIPARGDDDDDDHDHSSASVKAPSVDSGKTDRLNPPIEYEVLDLDDLAGGELKKKLNEMGEEGWALLTTSPSFIFRRIKKTEDEKKKGRVGFGISK
jgi:hypothetical protein